jgi:poly-gamma-glutamate capsule biosynthesis protein CapA/YwtB (metallophosphatase superfamily)
VRVAPVLTAICLALAAALTASAAHGTPAAVITISAVGDMAMAPSGDGGAGFFSAPVRGELIGDVVLGNLEGTLTTAGYSKCGAGSTNCYAFRVPPSYAEVLKRAGFTILNVANNHAYDFGAQGQAETLAALTRAGLRFTGRPGQITYLRVGKTSVAVIGFASYSWAQSLTDIAAARRIVRRADEKADIVIVTMHAGAEGSDHEHVAAGTETFLGENRGNVLAFSHAVIDAGADLVIGHGPHVLRGMEWYRGRLIAYSLGNFLGNGTLSISGVLGVSGVLHVSLRPDGTWVRGDLTPIRLLPPGLPALDPAEAAHGVVRDLSKSDFGRSAMRVTRKGVLLPPSWRVG